MKTTHWAVNHPDPDDPNQASLAFREDPTRDDDEPEDDRPEDDWCRVNGWDSCRDCPTCGGSGKYDDCTACPDCDGEGIIDR